MSVVTAHKIDYDDDEMCAYPVQAMATFASRLALPRLWPRARVLSQRRYYRVKPKYYKDVAQRYAKFRREVSERRKEFHREWFEREQAAQSELRAKAVEEARRREMEEVRALEEARKELEKMARERLVKCDITLIKHAPIVIKRARRSEMSIFITIWISRSEK